MKVEIWSDVVCPFCYIGKRKFEEALSQFNDREAVEIEWKSFQLQPDAKSEPGLSVHQSLANHKGIAVDQAKQMADQVTLSGASVGLQYDFDHAVVANTFHAHRLLHFAKEAGKQDALKERLLKAYFVLGEDIGDKQTLSTIADEVGMESKKVSTFLDSDELAMEVKADIQEAQQLSIHGVPFFVFDRKYGVSGAQDPSVFLQTLEKARAEAASNN